MTNTFKTDDLIRIGKRENNAKRSYLYVNPIQGKHIPVSPTLALDLFSQLAKIVESRYSNESLLVIGFAETATAIGSAIAYKSKNCKYYLNTTREDIPDAEYLFFTESHSHATEQRLVINGIDTCLHDVSRIVFAEDEVTTGNTIVKLIRILQAKYPKENLQFGIISVLNSMSDQRLKELQSEGIVCDFLHRIPVQYRVDEINSHVYLPLRKEPQMEVKSVIDDWKLGAYWNSRMVSSVLHVRNCVDEFVQNVMEKYHPADDQNDILILGTEEFMFPGMLLGKEIEALHPDKVVRFHATTRSPIEVCNDGNYPLHNRMPLESVYGEGRRTFIYNLRKYDKVLVVSDAANTNTQGLLSIYAALEEFGNDNITLIRWGDNCDEE